MSNIVQFLETLGGSAASNRLSVTAYTASVDALGLEATMHQALLARDSAALNQLLGGREQVRCAIATPD